MQTIFDLILVGGRVRTITWFGPQVGLIPSVAAELEGDEMILLVVDWQLVGVAIGFHSSELQRLCETGRRSHRATVGTHAPTRVAGCADRRAYGGLSDVSGICARRAIWVRQAQMFVAARNGCRGWPGAGSRLKQQQARNQEPRKHNHSEEQCNSPPGPGSF